MCFQDKSVVISGRNRKSYSQILLIVKSTLNRKQSVLGGLGEGMICDVSTFLPNLFLSVHWYVILHVLQSTACQD